MDLIFLVCNESHPGLTTIKKRLHRSAYFNLYFRFFTSKFSKGIGSHHFYIRYLSKVICVLLYRVLQYPILFPWYLVTLYAHFKKNKYDRLIVVNGGYPASLLCRSAIISWAFYKPKFKGIFNFHNSLGRFNWWNFIFEPVVDYLVLISSNYIVGVSSNSANSIRKKWIFLKTRKIKWIYNGIEDPISHLQNPKLSIGIKSSYILMLATYEKRKGHIFLIEAFKLLVLDYPNLELFIYGHGSIEEKEVIESCVVKNRLEHKVFCNDFIDDPSQLIASAELLVVPSQEYESFGLTIIEAMSLFTPIVATNIGGIPEVLKDSGAGLLVDPHNIDDLARQMKKILDSKKFAVELGECGRRTYLNKFSAKQMSSQYYDLL